MKRFARYAGELEQLVLHAAAQPKSKETERQVALALDGGPAHTLRQTVSLGARRRSGAFFTNAELARELVANLIPRLRAGASVRDVACGSGNLLAACAYHLPTAGDLQQTLQTWGEWLGGNDVHDSFVRAAKARLALVAIERGVAGPQPQIETIFPKIRTASAFKEAASITKADCITLNPPFTTSAAPANCKWASGKVSTAALMIELCVLNAKPGTQIVAILPEVLRTGSHYERWRHMIESAAVIESVEVVGLFDEYTDVDVFILRLRVIEACKASKEGWWRSEKRIPAPRNIFGNLFDVRVGPVVPHRDPHKGNWHPFITAREMPPWKSVRTDDGFKHRRFSGTTYQPPFLVVRRTSRPGDQHRAIATLVKGHRVVAVENHLLVLKPKSGLVHSCQSALERLARPETDTWLNERIRCRHLTVSSVAEIPWWH